MKRIARGSRQMTQPFSVYNNFSVYMGGASCSGGRTLFRSPVGRIRQANREESVGLYPQILKWGYFGRRLRWLGAWSLDN